MKQQQQDTDLLAALRAYEVLLRDTKAVRTSVKMHMPKKQASKNAHFTHDNAHFKKR